ncbi:MAG: hypothetical protein EPN37_04020 [Chitinophagaceae bacterium]|nr:MAG: hypothetical protein EPN37_04020 [Chitinophagaceae bacterium]
MNYRRIFPLFSILILPVFRPKIKEIGRIHVIREDTPSAGQICDTSTFRITYKSNNGSWLLDDESLSGDETISAGQNNINGNYDGWLLKTTKYGNIVWTKNYGSDQNDYFKRVIQTNDGGFLAVGSMQNTVTTPNQVNGYGWAVKTDANGNIIWSYKLSIQSTDMQRAIQTNDGGYALVASVNLTGGATGIIIIKINANGSLQWMKEYSNGSSASGYYIKQSLDSNFLISGFVFGMGAGMHDGFLMKVSSNDRSLLWLKTYGSPADDVIDCFDQDLKGNLLLALYWGGQ